MCAFATLPTSVLCILLQNEQLIIGRIDTQPENPCAAHVVIVDRDAVHQLIRYKRLSMFSEFTIGKKKHIIHLQRISCDGRNALHNHLVIFTETSFPTPYIWLSRH